MFIPEITTTWNVTVHDDRLEDAIDTFNNDQILSSAGADVLARLESAKAELENLGHQVAHAIGETQKSYQEQYIRMNGTVKTGMMLNSVEITEDGMGTVHVGNTASSVEGFPYPLAIETGRGPVYPINRKVLRWFNGGKPVFAKSAGPAKARPFVEPSQSSTMEDVEKIVDDYMKNIFG